jgi:uncharacterized protein YyaL (SSP411 family)
LNFLSRVYARKPNSDSGKHALEMNLFTLRKMASGGMHDHLGGGFHRYSVDAYWHVPHFEKMLYDQAQLAVAYLDAFQITREPLFEEVARDTLDYVRHDMTAKGGGFFSAEDADSVIPGIADPGHSPKAEGAFYVWDKTEVDAVLGPDAEIFNFHYAVKEGGNVPSGGDPHGEFTGKNILIELGSVAATAEHFGKDETEVRQPLAKAREALLAVRVKRPRPHLDDKIITAWNGLMISAFARAAQVLGDPGYLDAALRAATFLSVELYDGSRKVLFRNYREGRSAVEGFADDYAFFIQGLLDLYEASFDVGWLRFAIELQAIQDQLFFDEAGGGYFNGAGNDPSILLRLKEDNDSAEPAASSVAALNLLRLAQIRNDGDLFARADKTIEAFAPQIGHFASAMPQMLVALDLTLSEPRQIVIAGARDASETHALVGEVHRHFVPNKVLLLADGGDGQRYLEEKLEVLRGMKPVDGKATAYVCENFTCKAPVTDPKALGALLGAGTPSCR